MALVGALVDLFQTLILVVHVDDLAHDTSDFSANGNWPSAEIFFTLFSPRVDETAAEFVLIACSSASVKYFM